MLIVSFATNPCKPRPVLDKYAFFIKAFSSSTSNMSKHARSQSQDDALRHPSTKRAKEIDSHTPLVELESALKKSKGSHTPRNVLHWFRSKDLRMEDNWALAEASKKAREAKGHLITMYLFSPKDMDWVSATIP